MHEQRVCSVDPGWDVQWKFATVCDMRDKQAEKELNSSLEGKSDYWQEEKSKTMLRKAINDKSTVCFQSRRKTVYLHEAEGFSL